MAQLRDNIYSLTLSNASVTPIRLLRSRWGGGEGGYHTGCKILRGTRSGSFFVQKEPEKPLLKCFHATVYQSFIPDFILLNTYVVNCHVNFGLRREIHAQPNYWDLWGPSPTVRVALAEVRANKNKPRVKPNLTLVVSLLTRSLSNQWPLPASLVACASAFLYSHVWSAYHVTE